MAEENRYYKGIVPNSIKSAIYKIIVGYAEDQFKKPTGNQIVIKLPKGDVEQHPELSSYIEITQQEAIDLIDSWAE